MDFDFRHLALASVLVAAPISGHAQGSTVNYPTKPVRFIVPFAAGGMTDIMGRTSAGILEKAFGQQAIVENRGGAGGQVGTAMVARASPDGLTLLLGSLGTHGIAPILYRKLAYDPVRDFEHVAMLAMVGNLLVVHPSVPARNLKELIAIAKANPGKLNYGAIGGSSHLMTELISTMAGIKTTHVPYKGGAPAQVGVLSGEVDYLVTSLSLLLPQVEAGRLRGIAVTTARRSSLAPNIPTIAESGLPGYDASTWFSIQAPAGTPLVFVNRLNQVITAALKTQEVAEGFGKLNAQIKLTTPEQTAEFLRSEIVKWGKVVKAAGIPVTDQ